MEIKIDLRLTPAQLAAVSTGVALLTAQRGGYVSQSDVLRTALEAWLASYGVVFPDDAPKRGRYQRKPKKAEGA